MLDFIAIRDAIQAGLQGYLRGAYPGILVVFANSGMPAPRRPYVAMNFTSPYIPEPGQAGMHMEIVPYDPARWGHNPPKDFESDVQHTRRTQPEMVCSFTVYDNDQDRAPAIGLTAIRYFDVDGYAALKAQGIIPAEIMALQNRDVYLVDAWERRVGFDVRFRVSTAISHYSDTIETVDVRQKP